MVGAGDAYRILSARELHAMVVELPDCCRFIADERLYDPHRNTVGLVKNLVCLREAVLGPIVCCSKHCASMVLLPVAKHAGADDMGRFRVCGVDAHGCIVVEQVRIVGGILPILHAWCERQDVVLHHEEVHLLPSVIFCLR